MDLGNRQTSNYKAVIFAQIVINKHVSKRHGNKYTGSISEELNDLIMENITFKMDFRIYSYRLI